jgi:hypothetical protein
MAMSKLDHIVILLPVSETPEVLFEHAQRFKKIFTLLRGGFHTGGKSQNILVSLADGVYLELIAFTSTPSEGHRWNHRKPTRIIDFAFLGHPEKVKELYQEGSPGGRGECRWTVTMPNEVWGEGRLPFWCEDITPRELRVPKPTEHPSGVNAIRKITILVDSQTQRERLTKLYRELGGTGEMKIGTPSGGEVIIDIRVAETEDEKEALFHDGEGIYKVEFDIPGIVLSNSSL